MTTIRIKLPKIDQVTFTLSATECDIPVRGNALASGNNATDKAYEDEIIDRLDNGDIWAWASVTLTAEWRGIEGADHLGGCCYKDEADFKRDGYYADMKQIAFDDLIAQITALKTP